LTDDRFRDDFVSDGGVSILRYLARCRRHFSDETLVLDLSQTNTIQSFQICFDGVKKLLSHLGFCAMLCYTGLEVGYSDLLIDHRYTRHTR